MSGVYTGYGRLLEIVDIIVNGRSHFRGSLIFVVKTSSINSNSTINHFHRCVSLFVSKGLSTT